LGSSLGGTRIHICTDRFTGSLTTPSRRLAPREEYQKKDPESESSGSNPLEGGE
jgi:hypothetical protein